MNCVNCAHPLRGGEAHCPQCGGAVSPVPVPAPSETTNAPSAGRAQPAIAPSAAARPGSPPAPTAVPDQQQPDDAWAKAGLDSEVNRDRSATVVDQPFPDGVSAGEWCDEAFLAPDDCYAELLSHTSGPSNSTLLRQ